MGKNKKSKKKPASAKRRKKTSVKIKNLPAKHLEDREVLGGLSNPTLERSTQSFGGVALKRGEALNLGL